jgi:multisubunit Na+/H+ antiporter MnhE subunit
MELLRRCRIFAFGAFLAGAFYLLLIDTTSLPELYVLAGVALAGAISFVVSREQGYTEASVPATVLIRVWRVLLQIPRDVAVLCGEAVLQLLRPRARRGGFRAVPFAAVRDTPEHEGRRALTEWLGSLAPNTIVVGVDDERRLLLVHQLRRHGDTDDVDPLRP